MYVILYKHAYFEIHVFCSFFSGYPNTGYLKHDLLIVICPESRRTYIATVSKIIFFPIELKLFSSRFGPLGLRNCNKNFVCLCLSCICLLPVCLMKFVTGLAVTAWPYLYEIWYTCVSMGYLETLKKDF